MEKWQWIALILCGFGFFKEFRPSEPFLTQYLIQYKNITQEQLVHVAYPIATYTYLLTLAIVFLVTDFLRYRSIVILEGIAYVATWGVLTWGKDFTSFIFVEILYGIVSSTEVAYFTYIYAKVGREHYQKVTSYTYSALFFGRFIAGVTSQLLVSYDLMNYHELNYISFGSMMVALTLSFFLPKVKQSIYFYREVIVKQDNSVNVIVNGNANQAESDSIVGRKNLSFLARVKRAFPVLWIHFKSAYTNHYVLKWSIWWAVATAGHLQVINYIQPLWESIEKDDGTILNGAVEAIHTLLSTILAFGVGYLKVPWFKYGEAFLGIISLIEARLLYWMAVAKELNVAYICYIAFRTLYQVVITIASGEVAKGIREDSHGLVFGINTFIALVVQTIITVVVTDEIGLELPERTQFKVYGAYYGVLGILFVIVTMYTICKYGCNNQSKEQMDIAEVPNSTNIPNGVVAIGEDDRRSGSRVRLAEPEDDISFNE